MVDLRVIKREQNKNKFELGHPYDLLINEHQKIGISGLELANLSYSIEQLINDIPKYITGK